MDTVGHSQGPPATTARVLFADHHQDHAASAFLPSPFDRAAILTVDGVGRMDNHRLRQRRGQPGHIAGA